MDFHVIINDTTREALFVRHPDFEGNWEKKYFPNRPNTDCVYAERVYDEPVCGLYYTWELADPGGADIYLYVPAGTPKYTVLEAKHELREQHDVVGIQVIRLKNNPALEGEENAK